MNAQLVRETLTPAVQDLRSGPSSGSLLSSSRQAERAVSKPLAGGRSADSGTKAASAWSSAAYCAVVSPAAAAGVGAPAHGASATSSVSSGRMRPT